MSASNRYPLEPYFHPVKSTLALLANRGFSQPLATALKSCLDARCVTERERERDWWNTSKLLLSLFISLKSQSFGGFQTKEWEAVHMHVWILFKKMRRISLHSGISSMQKTKDLSERRVYMDVGSTRRKRLQRLSETGNIMKTYYSAEKKER